MDQEHAETVTDESDNWSQRDGEWLTPRDKQIGAHIRRQRVLAGMSRSGMARSLGIGDDEVEAYELGQRWVATTRLFEIAELLGVDLASFYAEIPATTAHGARVAGQAADTAEVRRLVACKG